MTDEEKKQINVYRKSGYGYKQISNFTGLSLNTIKSYCRRNNLTQSDLVSDKIKHYSCQQCGKEILQNEHRKLKRFCSDKCRNKWWNSHLSLVKRKANYQLVCKYCNKTFVVYGNKNRKFCCHNCYVKYRFGGVKNE